MKEQEISCPLCKNHKILKRDIKSQLTSTRKFIIPIKTILAVACPAISQIIRNTKPRCSKTLIRSYLKIGLYNIEQGNPNNKSKEKNLIGLCFVFEVRVNKLSAKRTTKILSYSEALDVINTLRNYVFDYFLQKEQEGKLLEKGKKNLTPAERVACNVQKFINPFFKALRETTVI